MTRLGPAFVLTLNIISCPIVPLSVPTYTACTSGGTCMVMTCFAGGPCDPTMVAVAAIFVAACWDSVVASEEVDVAICRKASTTTGSSMMSPKDSVMSSSRLDWDFLRMGAGTLS